MKGRVLVIAGSDSCGGAGIQADIKTVTALGGYAATAITALTAQDTRKVHAVQGVEPDFVRRQMIIVLADIGADVIKTGMLFSAETIRTTADVVRAHAPNVPLVVDPVLWATSGDALFEPDAVRAFVDHLVPLAALVTPNLPETEALTGLAVRSAAERRAAGRALLELGARAALVKGGHDPHRREAGDVDSVVDLLVARSGLEVEIISPRIRTRSTHGTGCTLASAVAVGLAQGLDLEAAFRRAHAYVQRAIARAPGFGSGHGPLDHTWPLDSSEG